MKPFQLPGKKLYLVRHGLATTDPQGYGDKKMTAGLLPQGEKAIEKIAQYLMRVPDSWNVSSPVPRCRETASIISRYTGKPFEFEPLLAEFHQESFENFRLRIGRFLEKLSRVQEENIIICSHSAVITGIKDLLITGTFSFEKEYDYPKEGELLIIQGNGYRTLSFNGVL